MLGKPCGKPRAESMNVGTARAGIYSPKGLQRRLLRADVTLPKHRAATSMYFLS